MKTTIILGFALLLAVGLIAAIRSVVKDIRDLGGNDQDRAAGKPNERKADP